MRLYYVGWSTSTGEADWALRPLLYGESWPPRLFNTAYYKNDEGRRRHQERAARRPTAAEKAKLYKDAQETIWNDAPWAPLVVEKLLSAHNKKLSGVYVIPDASFNFNEIDLQVNRRNASLAALARHVARGESHRGTLGTALRVPRTADASAERSRDRQRCCSTSPSACSGLLPTLLLVGFLVFLFVHLLPGDPARLAAGPDATPETVELVRKDLGLDRPLPQQFVRFVNGVLHWDFGTSLRTKRPVRHRNRRRASCRRSGSRSGAWAGRCCSAWRSASCPPCGATAGPIASA